MRLIRRFGAFVGAEIPTDAFGSAGSAGIDAYDLLDELPRGPAQDAAWCAYALQTYGDKLTAASEAANSVQADTVQIVRDSYRLAGVCLTRARELAAAPGREMDLDLPGRLPHWWTPIRSQEQLTGMRKTLEALRTHIAFDLGNLADAETATAAMHEGLAAVDARLETVDRLWAPRAPEELRGGIGDALTIGLDRAYALGQLLANPQSPA